MYPGIEKLRMLPVIMVAAALLLCPRLRAEDEGKTTPEECCYVHPNYQGVCAVAPAEDESCEGILLYLNTPATVGKTYCGNTRIRGGWERVQCPEKEDNPPSVSLPVLW